MSAPLTVSPPFALGQLSAALAELHAISGRSAESILITKGGQLLFGNQNPKYGATFRGLYSLFKREAPVDHEIYDTAKARGFRVGRKALGGELSPLAIERARAMMGGYKSILVNPTSDGRGLSFVRAGVQRKVKRVLYRPGRKSSAVSGSGLFETGAGFERRPGDIVVNLRAVATHFELILREHGRGFLASGWLQKRWKKFAKEGLIPEGTAGLKPGWGKSRQFGGTIRRLENINPRSTLRLLGEAEMTGAEDSGNVTLRISTYVPGVLAVGEGRGLFNQAINAVVADIGTYLARKQAAAVAAAVGAPSS